MLSILSVYGLHDIPVFNLLSTAVEVKVVMGSLLNHPKVRPMPSKAYGDRAFYIMHLICGTDFWLI